MIDFIVLNRIAQEDSTKYLKGIVQTNGISSTLEESASELQRKFEGIIHDDTEMHDRACKGNFLFLFVSSFIC